MLWDLETGGEGKRWDTPPGVDAQVPNGQSQMGLVVNRFVLKKVPVEPDLH